MWKNPDKVADIEPLNSDNPLPVFLLASLALGQVDSPSPVEVAPLLPSEKINPALPAETIKAP